MHKQIWTKIVGTGSYIPSKIIKNEDFLDRTFYDAKGELITIPVEETIKKFEEITGIKERRYIEDEYVTSDMAYFAAQNALESANIDKETLDAIIVAHNFGDVQKDNIKTDIVPSLAARVKNKLQIKNPFTVVYDIIFGCPGWLQGVIQADNYIKAGSSKRVMVIGAEALSRVSDPYDRDSMIYSDGAGASILESVESDEPTGILSNLSRSDTLIHSRMLWMGKSNNPNYKGNELFLKMNGHNLYKYALQTVPSIVKEALNKIQIALNNVKMVFIHQANNKMDEEILKRIYQLFDFKSLDASQIFKIMPMTISWLGNSSVATLPTLIDLLLKEKFQSHKISIEDTVAFASVGAGMNINSVIYKF